MFDKEAIKLGLILGSIALVLAILLSVANMFTKDIIAERQNSDTQKALSAVMQNAEFEKTDYTAEDDGTEVYTAKKDEQQIGYCVKVTPQGYGGTITMIVGIDMDYNITGVSIPESGINETPGLGAHVAESAFLNQYIGKSGELSVSKDGGEIEAVSGATISSRAVTSGVNKAIKTVKSLGGAVSE